MDVSKLTKSALAFALLFLVSIKADPTVSDNGNNEKEFAVFGIRSSLMLDCNITQGDNDDVKWEKNGTDVTKIESLKGRYEMLKSEKKFMISRAEVADDGPYSCTVGDKRHEFVAIAKLVVRVPSNVGVVEGEKLSIHCQVLGSDPEITWEYGNITLSNSTDRYILKADENNENAILVIENASLDDRGEYRCVARNAASERNLSELASDASYVRVKGKLAALWPFLGICAEVFILCAIILVYERRRNKAELDESDTDPNTEQ